MSYMWDVVCICVYSWIAIDTALRALLDAGFRCLATRVACQWTFAPPRASPRLRRPAARAGTPLRWFGWTPHHPPSDKLRLSSVSPRLWARLEGGFPLPCGRGGGAPPPTQTAAWAAQIAGAICLCRRPRPKMKPLGRHHFGDCGKTRVLWLRSVRFALSTNCILPPL